ncbi:hypothetical protein HXX76_009967 [Chlamydomonas incerta]|uniref:Phosphodiesterase n=1 Tax=Chlamydomonas incerta TaxID=51695 RepID=A0A835SY90_CHLIN|nr:hypothetical protein HXX76_009967 [Chlamydomonas incerta]|eukprot:KAG2430444.1 hypothetical protein HXX76_009967 [Chlamydomonas incerta]
MLPTLLDRIQKQLQAESFKAEAQSVARNAAAQYRGALIDAFLPVDILAAHIRRAPDYRAVTRLFNSSASLLFETVPSSALLSLQLLPAGVLRMAYPPHAEVAPPLGTDIFAVPNPEMQDSIRHSLADGHISIDGPVEMLPGLRVLIVRQAVFVDVSNPGETFGRPDAPNPTCGALCRFQPYNTTGGGAPAGGAAAGRLFWGMAAAVIHMNPFADEAPPPPPTPPTPPPSSTSNGSYAFISSSTPSPLLADELADYEHIGAAAAALRALSELGYRYRVVTDAGRTMASSAQPPPAPGGGAAVVEAPISLPGTQWVLRVSPSSSSARGDSSWMPKWTGGAIAAVVVSAAIAAIMLFGLLVSRRRHALLLAALLPPDLLSSGLRSAHVVEKHLAKSGSGLIPESPAELLMDLLAELLAGQSPDLRQVVLLRSLLLRNADWYRPLGMGGQLMHNANLESDVAQALMRQLGTCVLDDDGIGGGGGGGVDGTGGLGGGQGSTGTCGGEGDTGDSSSGYLHDLSNVTPTTRQMLLLRREREAAAAEKCRTLRGALSLIMAPQDLSDSSNKSLNEVTAAAAAPGDGTLEAAESRRGSLDDGGGRGGSRGRCGSKGGGGSWAAAAAVALAAAAAVGPPSRPSSPPSLPRPASLAALLHQWSVGGSANAANGIGASRGASAAAAAPPATAGNAGNAVEEARAASNRRSSMPYPTSAAASSPLAPGGLLASLARRRSSAMSSYNHMMLQQTQSASAVTVATAAAGAAGSPRLAVTASLNTASAAAMMLSSATAPQSTLQRSGSSQLPALPATAASGGAAVAAAGAAGAAASVASTAASVSGERTVLAPPRLGWSLRRSRHSNGPASAPSLAAAAAALGAPPPQQAAAALLDEGADTFCYLPPPPTSCSTVATAAAGTPRGSGGGAAAAPAAAALQQQQSDVAAGILHDGAADDKYVELCQMPSTRRHGAAARAAAGASHGAAGRGGMEETEAVVDVAKLMGPGGGGRDSSSSRRRGSAATAAATSAAVARYRTHGSIGSNSYGSSSMAAAAAAGGALNGAMVTASGARVRVKEELLMRTATPPLVPPAATATAASAEALMVLRAPMLDKVEALLARADELQYDMWALADATAGRPLSVLAFFLFQRQGLIRHFHIKPVKLIRLLRALEAGYRADNPYHNATHAADVLRTTHVLAAAAGVTVHHVDTLGLMALYFAAIIHDFGHPGLTGDFLVATSHPLALRYNDRSPLENHHASAAFTLMAEHLELDAFEVLSREQRIAFRKQVVELVMGTDMKQHFALLSQFTNAVSAQRLKQQHQQQQAAASAAASPVDGVAGGSGGVRPGGGGGSRKKGRTLSGIMSRTSDGDRTKSGPPSMFNANKLSVQRASDPAGDADSVETTAEDRPRALGTFAALSMGPVGPVPPPLPPPQPSPSSPRAPPQHQQTSRFARQSLPASRAAAATRVASGACAAPPPAPPADEAQRLLALQICLKVADIGHLAGTLPVHKRWLGVLEEEFFRQGDRERELGLPISPLFDRAKQGVSKSQVGFFEFVALPLARALTSAFPGATPVISCFEFNYQYWKEQQQKQQQQQQQQQQQAQPQQPQSQQQDKQALQSQQQDKV